MSFPCRVHRRRWYGLVDSTFSVEMQAYPPGVLAPNHTRMRSSAFPFHFSHIANVPIREVFRSSTRPGCIAQASSFAYFAISITILPRQPRMPLSSTARQSPSNPYRSANSTYPSAQRSTGQAETYHTLQEASRPRQQHLPNAQPSSGISVRFGEIALKNPDPLAEPRHQFKVISCSA